ncbi:MAG: amidohydrolase [Acidimicrobiia bacterium]|nr:amidohydrolase [Acidimicrobiia bacterium]
MAAELISARGIRLPDGVPGDSLVVTEGVVTAIGMRNQLSGYDTETRYEDAILIPGLRDAHIHPVAYAAALRGATLGTATSFAEVTARLRTEAAKTPPPIPLLGMRLNEEALAERRLPDRYVLDAAADDRPVLAHRYCGHVAIANSAALALAGIDNSTPDPGGGSIDRDPTGEPTGVLRETAIELVAERLQGANTVGRVELLGALERLAAVGITSIGAMLRTGVGAWASLGNEVDIAVDAAPEMPIKVHAYVIEDSPETVAANKAKVDAAAPRLTWRGIKRFGDGSFGGHTAAMYEPFLDVDSTGTLRLTGLDRVIAEESLRLGGAVAIHAIGDRACGDLIDMYVDLLAAGADPAKLRVEHASVMTERDIVRVAEAAVRVVVQPPFMGSEASWLGQRLGADRLERTYPFASLESAGAVLAGSSDCPVEPPDPWAGMALAQDRAGMSLSQAVSAASALAMYTTGAALALEEPTPLAIGSPADFVVVDRDPMLVTPDELRDTEVVATYVDGQEVNIDRTQPLWLD